MNKFKFYIGPMSKNVVDAVIEFTEETENKIGFIPSRRQVEFNGGYVNNWTTSEFATYVNGRVPIERDHGGVGQGYRFDDGMESFLHDSQNFNIIHVDPWNHYQDLDMGLQETIMNLTYIHLNSSNVKFEVGTEESIRRFEIDELENMMWYLEKHLLPDVFEKIEYVVVQSGVGLDLGKQKNTGTFNSKRLADMISVCKKYGKKSKEHNGDYLSDKEYKDRFDLGLDSINIAPEFGQIETKCYLEEMGDGIQDYFEICYDSKRWEKWVDNDFVPQDSKEELIKICGHYVLSDQKFLNIKPNIDDKIKNVIKSKLKSLFE